MRLQGFVKWEELWFPLTRCANDLHLDHICLDVNAPALHEGYFARWHGSRSGRDSENRWSAELPLSTDAPPLGSLKISGYGNAESLRHVLVELSVITDRFLSNRLSSNRLEAFDGDFSECPSAMEDTVVSADGFETSPTQSATPIPRPHLRPALSASRNGA